MNNNGELSIQHTGSLHTIDNEDESHRLKKLDVDLDKVREHSKFTRCVG